MIVRKIDKYLVNESAVDFSKFHNKKVIITTKKGSKYAGLMISKGGNKNKVALRNLAVLNKDGSYKAVSGQPETRLFNRNSITNVKEDKEK